MSELSTKNWKNATIIQWVFTHFLLNFY